MSALGSHPGQAVLGQRIFELVLGQWRAVRENSSDPVTNLDQRRRHVHRGTILTDVRTAKGRLGGS
jgi:hypothetical protein